MLDGRRFDLIFSSQLGQFLTADQLERHVRTAATMLAPGGSLVVAANPWRRMRWAYSRGDLAGGRRRSFLVTCLYYARRFWHDPMGYWHDTPALRDLADEVDLEVEFFGSILYPYRFHAVFRLRG